MRDRHALGRLGKLVGRLGGRRRERRQPPDATPAPAEQLQQARAAASAWKARVSRLAREIESLKGRIDAARDRLGQARASTAATRREVPSPAVLRDAFLQRQRTLRARTEAAIDPRERERRLLAASTSYAALAVQDRSSLLSAAERLVVDGLTWWVPRKKPGEPLSRQWIAKQRFPFHGILQARELATGGIMLDLGANVGRMAVPRVMLGDATAAYCAEPDPVNFECLVANVVDNGLHGLVLPDRVAIGDRDGTVRLLRAGAPGRFRVIGSGPPEGGHYARGEVATGGLFLDVPCSTLDSWVARLDIDLDAVTFVKVDVEGYERRVVAGAARVLGCPHIAWQMEIKPEGLRAADNDPQELYRELQRAFSHFIDLNRRAAGPRVRPVGELSAALRYLERAGKTDILLFNHV